MLSMTPIYFFHEGQPGGYLSNFYPSPFNDDKDPSIRYKTSEHYMMYHKALTFNDKASANAILKASTCKEAKGLGRQVENFDAAEWKKHRARVVTDGCLLKFRQHPNLKQQLLETKERELVEASPYDRIWGIGFKAEEASKRSSEWGLNLLGKCLSEVRKRLREEDEKQEAGEAGTPTNIAR